MTELRTYQIQAVERIEFAIDARGKASEWPTGRRRRRRK
jgi:hypothetical protein